MKDRETKGPKGQQLMGLRRAHLTEEFGDDATLQRMLECFRDPEVCEEMSNSALTSVGPPPYIPPLRLLLDEQLRSASIQPGVIKEPTFSLQKSRSSMLPVIQGECGARTMCTSEGRRKPPGPLSEILSAAITKRDQLPSQRSGRRPQTNSRQARTPVNLRGIYNSTLASWKASSLGLKPTAMRSWSLLFEQIHAALSLAVLTVAIACLVGKCERAPNLQGRPLAADKEPKVMASAVMMPVPRFVSVRRSRSKSYALPELPEAPSCETQGGSMRYRMC
eukprot:g9735.t1